MMAFTDINNIERLRKENLDQFFTLVRMHLSFVVDVNIDDVDNSTDRLKQFRWNFHRKTKGTSNSNQNNLSSAKHSDNNSITEEGISRVNELIEFLSKEENIVQEGIFRRTGSLSRQNELRMLLLSGSELKLEQGKFSVHDCASVLKGFLAELPQPLLMDQYYQIYCTLAVQYPPNAESSEAKLLTALQLLFLLLTPLHRSFLKSLLRLLKVAADNETSNRMSPDTLATMFTPHLLCPRKLSPEAFHADSLALAPVTSFMIRHSEKLFEPPEQLATDVAAYFTIRERKKMLSPDIDLDESITDRTAASTVYTFVDRRRTGAENASNNTDAALAQLYAHIQSLPDSQHKRRLIKQFNRQNGYGTPIQIQRTGKVAGSKSFGDSIKRHIFHKGLLNKTPKKMCSSSMIKVEEKISFISKEKLKYANECNNSTDVCHKNIVMKNLVNRMASTESLDDNVDFDSDASNDSTISDDAILNRSHKLSPKFVSEPNLSLIDNRDDNETPKIGKKRVRLFRSKLATQNLNKKYAKKAPIRSTPTCVTCFEDLDSESDNEILLDRQSNSEVTPRKPLKPQDNTEDLKMEHEESLKLNYLTSTPGISDVHLDDKCMTPYTMNFRRASMSPITKSTQKLSKAMQESIMTPRSRKPLIVTSEQRDNHTTIEEVKPDSTHSSDTVYQSLSPKNDSDFISSDEENVTSSHHSDGDRKRSAFELNTTFLGNEEWKSDVIRQKSQYKGGSLTEPFREYLLSRSVLTATPVDLSLLNKTNDAENSNDVISESLMYCLDGNMPSDLTSSIGNLAVGNVVEIDKSNSRSPLKNLNSFVNIDLSSPNRKRTAKFSFGTKGEENTSNHSKRVIIEKENLDFQLRETDL